MSGDVDLMAGEVPDNTIPQISWLGIKLEDCKNPSNDITEITILKHFLGQNNLWMETAHEPCSNNQITLNASGSHDKTSNIWRIVIANRLLNKHMLSGGQNISQITRMFLGRRCNDYSISLSENLIPPHR